jgi:peptide/nickel transport system permease protein
MRLRPFYLAFKELNSMPPIAQFILRRLLSIPITLLIVTAALYAIAMLAPLRARAMLYWPPNLDPSFLTREQEDRIVDGIIEKWRLKDPYPVQYLRWASQLLQGNWGYSPVLRGDVLEYLLRRTPTTAELTLYSVLLFIPSGLASGVIAARRRNRAADHGFRLFAFVGTSIPPFILALILLSLFYVGLRWFPLGRIDNAATALVRSDSFQTYTGLLTLDGLLNGRIDISLKALHHLVLPVFTLSLAHWATLGRVTRVAMIEELDKEYVVAARGRGLRERTVVWGHALRNALIPALTSSALSTASLITGVYIVEVIFALHGVSDVLVASLRFGTLDVATGLGFAVYSVVAVLAVLFVLDLIQAVVDPRVREGIVRSS